MMINIVDTVELVWLAVVTLPMILPSMKRLFKSSKSNPIVAQSVATANTISDKMQRLQHIYVKKD